MRNQSGIVGILIVGAIVIGACGHADRNGENAPDFDFSLYQGNKIIGLSDLSLSDLRGRSVVINFWAGLCPPCIVELPDIQEFYDDMESQTKGVSMGSSTGIILIGVDIGRATGLGSTQDAIDLLKDLNITYPTAYVSEKQQNEVIINYRIMTIPTTVFINADGKIFRKWEGILNREVLTQITEDMLN